MIVLVMRHRLLANRREMALLEMDMTQLAETDQWLNRHTPRLRRDKPHLDSSLHLQNHLEIDYPSRQSKCRLLSPARAKSHHFPSLQLSWSILHRHQNDAQSLLSLPQHLLVPWWKLTRKLQTTPMPRPTLRPPHLQLTHQLLRPHDLRQHGLMLHCGPIWTTTMTFATC